MQNTIRYTWLMALVGAALSVSLTNAQTPTPDQTAHPVGPQERASGTMTAVGCLQRSDRATSAPSPSDRVIDPAATGSMSQYVLRDVRIVTGETTSAAGVVAEAVSAAAAGAATPAAGDGREIRLVAGKGVKFDEHIGQQVSVTGRTLDTLPAEPARAPDAPAAGTAPRLEVTSLTTISAKCQTPS